jgi:hypothetical protein
MRYTHTASANKTEMKETYAEVHKPKYGPMLQTTTPNGTA